MRVPCPPGEDSPRRGPDLRNLFLVLAFLPLIGCASASAPPTAAPGDPSRAKTSLELIAEAERRGEVDADTAILYRVYAVRDTEKLPAAYRGSRPIKDGTVVLRGAKARFDSLRPETREALRPYLFPKGEP